MPRIRQKSYEYAMADLVKEIRVAGAKMGMNSVKEIAEAAGLRYDTIRQKFNNPGSMKLSELLPLMDALRMGTESLEPLVRGGRTK